MAENEIDRHPLPTQRAKHEFFVGAGLIVLVLVLLSLLFAFRGDSFDSPDWVAFYAGIALVTGLSFWLFTTTTGTVDLKELGIKLGGGGAVGAAFMILAWWFTPEPQLLLVDLPSEINTRTSRGVVIQSKSPDFSEAQVLPDGERMLVAFRDGRGTGSMTFLYFDPRTLEPKTKCFDVKRGKRALQPCSKPKQEGGA